MKDLTELRNILLSQNYISTVKQIYCRFNAQKKTQFNQWKNENIELWNSFVSYFDSEDEMEYYLLRPRLKEKVSCSICNKALTLTQIKSGRKTCSKECQLKASHTEEWSQKVKNNWKNKTPEELQTIKSHLEDGMMKKYGVRHNWCNGLLREKEKKTWMEKYGVDHPLKSKEVRQQIVKSLKENFEEGNYANRKKARQTCEERGSYQIISKKNKIAWTHKTEEDVKKRSKQTKETNLKKYGTITPWYLESSREKTRETCLKKYGVDHFSKAEEVKEKKKQTYLRTLGVDSPFKSKEVIERYRQNNLKKYGYAHLSQSPEFQSKTRKRYFYDNIWFDSSEEVYFYIYHKEILKDNIQKGKTFNYLFEGQKQAYHCDFLLGDKNIEIKGDQFIKDGKLYFPYRNQKQIDWEKEQRKWDEKFNCMKENNVKLILTNSEEMKNVRKAVDEKYTSDYVKLFNSKLEFPYLNVDLMDVSDLGLIHHFHKSIYSASRKEKLSPVEAWKNKSLIREIALNRLKYVGKCQPSDILQGFNVTLKAPKVSTFKPKLAEELIKKYIAKADMIIDPFSGFSGRMLGAFNCGIHYVGWDINEDHVKESNEIIDYQKISDMCDVKVQDLISFSGKDWSCLKNVCLFTCPPYGGKEHWNKNNDEVEKSCDEWIDLCLEKHQGCVKYLFVVDETEKYKNSIIETITTKSHFGERKEYVVLINKGDFK